MTGTVTAAGRWRARTVAGTAALLLMDFASVGALAALSAASGTRIRVTPWPSMR